jgi:hypothetical protein
MIMAWLSWDIMPELVLLKLTCRLRTHDQPRLWARFLLILQHCVHIKTDFYIRIQLLFYTPYYA